MVCEYLVVTHNVSLCQGLDRISHSSEAILVFVHLKSPNSSTINKVRVEMSYLQLEVELQRAHTAQGYQVNRVKPQRKGKLLWCSC